MTRTGAQEGEPEPGSRLGLWVIGARGGLATTAIVGARLLARGLVAPRAMVSENEPFRTLPGCVPLDRIVFGGHEVRPGRLIDAARQIARETRSLDPELLDRVEPDLAEIDAEIRPGTLQGCGRAIRDLVAEPQHERPGRELVSEMRRDLEGFRARHGLRHLVVVNVASTEPQPEHEAPLGDRRALDAALQRADGGGLPASALYAKAALEAGAAFVNFTPSSGALAPAILAEAAERGLPVVGDDGKTGETLVKSALARMFLIRDLKVLSWQGYNILGDRDGQVLADEANKSSKLATKDSVLRSVLGYDLHTKVGIDYVPSLSDLKTAWDFVHFEGFLGFKMSLQFTWQGCDAILAAPLVLDLARLMGVALERGEGGLRRDFAVFFKRPRDVQEHDLARQYEALEAWARAGGQAPTREA